MPRRSPPKPDPRAREMARVKRATAVAMIIGTLAILVAERRRPLRRSTQAEPSRALANLAMGAGCALAIAAAETPFVVRLARRAEASGTGLTQKLPLPRWGRDLIGIVLMDYTFYLWHVLTHELSALWRYHIVHHVDLDLDASTSIRFHALDMVISAPWRMAQVAVIGLSQRGLALWRCFFFLSILFHHSNLRLTERWERRLALVLTTPRMHGIHHTAMRDATNSNWSSGLSVWDRIHGTFRHDLEPDVLPIGVPAYQRPRDVTLTQSLVLPFAKRRDDWAYPSAVNDNERNRRKP